MPKLGMEPRRRADVINAALACIRMYGIDGMTLDKVAEQAGCSKGVVTYYYKNKDHLTLEAFKSFMAYYGHKIESELDRAMPAEAMLDVVLRHILPPRGENADATINVSRLDGEEKMNIPYDDQAKLFVQFFARAMLDRNLQEVIAESYAGDLVGIAKIFDYGKATGRMAVDDSRGAAYGLLAMTVGLSFFRVAGFPLKDGEDNRIVGEDYLNRYWMK
ncbi:TetR/AcrR family transcriptional regulator [Paenibacillus methanolicus]|uniref:TetR/AcrR family transcriptional repressor of bet genes n=1 Tax=Paenibacillus methanolicus TaxID=582686 RepID=A0A5S5C431_9BACL|nr:TetR family transcriptional regulator [Paenibacillus methanolicus]TYP74084.1 TetR/AcrR family transcriptional repressor of bet genes [Paenibacillus methanolicus]